MNEILISFDKLERQIAQCEAELKLIKSSGKSDWKKLIHSEKAKNKLNCLKKFKREITKLIGRD